MVSNAWTQQTANMATTRSQSRCRTRSRSRSRSSDQSTVAGRVKSGRKRARRVSYADPEKEAMDDDVVVVKEEEDLADDEMDDVEIVTSGDGEEEDERPRPIGEAIEVVGSNKRYAAFEYDGNQFELEDSVLITPEEELSKPGLAIIKGVSKALDGSIVVAVQWFYRPEDVKTAYGETWSALDNREILMTDHREELPASSILHKCVVHFLSSWEQLQSRKAHPGFIVHHFYDHLNKEVYKITDGKYTDSLRRDINLRIRKTQLRIGFEENQERSQ